jgi:hypothetical protein
MASNNNRKPRRHSFLPGDIAAMRKAGCKAGAEAMEKGRAPSGKDIRSLALINKTIADRIDKTIKSDGVVEETEFAGV